MIAMPSPSSTCGAAAGVRPLISGLDNKWELVGSEGARLIS